MIRRYARSTHNPSLLERWIITLGLNDAWELAQDLAAHSCEG